MIAAEYPRVSTALTRHFQLLSLSGFSYLLPVRLLCEIFAIGLLLWLGWSKSFQDWTNQMRGLPPPKSSAVASAPAIRSASTAPPPNVPYQPFNPSPARRAVAVPQATRSGDWMWDPAHRGTLDRPAYDPQKPSQTYQDAASRRYWMDAQGNRHYENGAPPPH